MDVLMFYWLFNPTLARDKCVVLVTSLRSQLLSYYFNNERGCKIINTLLISLTNCIIA